MAPSKMRRSASMADSPWDSAAGQRFGAATLGLGIMLFQKYCPARGRSNRLVAPRTAEA